MGEAVELLVLACGKSSFMTELKGMHDMHVVSMSRWGTKGHVAGGLQRILTLCSKQPNMQEDVSSNIVETHRLYRCDHGRSAVLDTEQELYHHTHSESYIICHRWRFFQSRMCCGMFCKWKASMEVRFKTPNRCQRSVETYWRRKIRSEYACFGAMARERLMCNQLTCGPSS